MSVSFYETSDDLREVERLLTKIANEHDILVDMNIWDLKDFERDEDGDPIIDDDVDPFWIQHNYLCDDGISEIVCWGTKRPSDYSFHIS